MGTFKENIDNVYNNLMSMPEDELRVLIKEHSEGDVAKMLMFVWVIWSNNDKK